MNTNNCIVNGVSIFYCSNVDNIHQAKFIKIQLIPAKKNILKNTFDFWSRISSCVLVLRSLSLIIVLKIELYLILLAFFWEPPVFSYYMSS